MECLHCDPVELLNVFQGGLARIDEHITALHGIDGHMVNQLFIYTHSGQIFGNADLIGKLPDFLKSTALAMPWAIPKNPPRG